MGTCECSPAGLRPGGAQRCPCECEAYQAIGKAPPHRVRLPSDRGRTSESGRDHLHSGVPALFPPLRRRVGSVEAANGDGWSTCSDSEHEHEHEWGDSGTRIHNREVKYDGTGDSTTCGSSAVCSSTPSRSPSRGTNPRAAAGMGGASQGPGPTVHELVSALDRLNHKAERLRTESEGEAEPEDEPDVLHDSLETNLSGAVKCAAEAATELPMESSTADMMPWVRRRIDRVPTPRTPLEVEESTRPIRRTLTPAHRLSARPPTPAHSLTLAEEDLASLIHRTPTPAHRLTDRPSPAGGGQCGSPGQPKVGQRRHSRPRSKGKRRDEH